MYARRGEVLAARSAAGKGVPFILSTVSVCALDEVVSGSRGSDLVSTLCHARSRTYAPPLGTRKVGSGCTALVVTVDMPVPGNPIP